MSDEKEVFASPFVPEARSPNPFRGSVSYPETPSIVVGIDFGTTYAGAAWAKSGSINQIEVISQWDSQIVGAADSEKVPSEICYDARGDPLKWGFGAKSSDESLQWIKLLLSPVESLGVMDKPNEDVLELTRKRLSQLRKSAVDVIADYLCRLWNHILEHLRRRLSAPVLDNMLLKVVLTIPAIWDHGAQTKMRTAAAKAGMLDFRPCGQTSISLIAEPAAAALATYFDSEIKYNPIVKTGDSFVVCDAGGGTVDLISYTIKSFDPFRLSECIGATGDLCGAIYLDRSFEAVVKTMRSKHVNSLGRESIKRFMEKEWEYGIKRNFDDTEGPWKVDLPQVIHRKHAFHFKKERSNTLDFKRDHLRTIFSEVVPKILDLLRDQVQGVKAKTGSLPKVIILVGGFGGNRYLMKEIENEFKPKGIIIQQPTRAWSAVCRGAVIRGVQGGDDIVGNHISKYSYGIACFTAWKEGRYLQKDKFFDEQRQSWYAGNQMQWYLNKNDDVNLVQEIEHSFEQIFDSARSLRHPAYKIYYSDIDNPGTRLEPHVRHLCTLKFDMSPFSYDALPVWVNSLGKEYRKIDLLIKMAVTVSSVDWNVLYNGTRLKTTVEYCDNVAGKVPT